MSLPTQTLTPRLPSGAAEPGQQARILNDFMADVTARLEALEDARVASVTARLRVGASLAPGTFPFPLQLRLPGGFTPTGVVVWRIADLSSGTMTTIIGPPHWTAADGALVIDFVGGLSLNTVYDITFGAYNA